MKSLQHLLLSAHGKLQSNRVGRLLCFLDTERSCGVLTQVSAIVCKETKNDVEIVDKFNLYITPENTDESRKLIMDFFYQYPDMLYVGNSVGVDTSSIAKHLLAITTEEYLRTSFSNKTTVDNLKSYIDNYGDTHHCHSIHLKLNLNCWLTNTVASATCPHISDCRDFCMQRLVFGADYAFIDSASGPCVDLFERYLGLVSDYHNLESLKLGLNITTFRVVDEVKRLYGSDIKGVSWHDSMFDTAVMYIIQRYLKIATTSKQAYLDMRLKELAENVGRNIASSSKFEYIGIVDTCFNNHITDSIGVIILKRNTLGLRLVDAMSITNLSRMTSLELSDKFLDFVHKYPKTFYCGHNIVPRLESMLDRLAGVEDATDTYMSVGEDYLRKIDNWKLDNSREGSDALKTIFGEDCAVFNLTNLLKRECYKSGSYIDVSLMNTTVLLNKLGVKRQCKLFMGEGYYDTALSNCTRLLELLIECVEGVGERTLRADSLGYLLRSDG